MKIRVSRWTGGVIVASILTGCGGNSAAPTQKAVAPAKIEAHPDERDIYRITLTEQAESRLGIETVPVTFQSIGRQRTVGGEVMLPDGAAVIVTAPVAGTVQLADSQTARPGMHIGTGEAFVTIKPLLSPERDVLTPAERVQVANAQVALISAKVAVEGDMKTAQAQVTAAEINLRRAEQLLQDRAGSAQAVDDAKAALAVANESLKAARQRVESLKDIRLSGGGEASSSSENTANDEDQKAAQAIPIRVSQAGVLRNLVVADGQYVTTGATLFEIVNLQKLWVRVPVYVGLLDQLQSSPSIQVRSLDQATSAKSVSAQSVVAPPSADPVAATADLYFAIDNADGRFRPGERVLVGLPLAEEKPRLVIPRTAVLQDIQGTSWVYARSGPQEYRRERVLVDFTTDDHAVLAYGPPEGTEVVTDGAAELFGTEFGAKK